MKDLVAFRLICLLISLVLLRCCLRLINFTINYELDTKLKYILFLRFVCLVFKHVDAELALVLMDPAVPLDEILDI